MSEKRISLIELWNETRLPAEAVQRLERGGWWAILWAPPVAVAWRVSDAAPQKTTVYKALYKYGHLGGRDWALLAKWEDVDMAWTSIGQFSK